VTPGSTPPKKGGGVATGGTDGGMPPSGGGGGTTGGGGGGDMGGGGGGTTGTGGGGDMGGGAGAACTPTQPERLTQAATDAFGLAVDDSAVYFTTQMMPAKENDFVLWTAPIGGGAATKVGTTTDYAATSVVVNADAVFTMSSFGVLERWPKDGSAPTVLSETTGNDFGSRAVADAGGYIYSLTQDGVVRIAETGGAVQAIGNVADPLAFAFDATDIYVTSDKSIVRVPRGGGPTSVATQTPDPLDGVAVDDAHVYTGGFGGTVYVADKQDGASATALFSTGMKEVDDLFVDSGHLYYRADTLGSSGLQQVIGRVALDGSGKTVLATVAGDIGRVQIRGSYVYYTFANDSSVYRVCK
jgi:hypothetical protein